LPGYLPYHVGLEQFEATGKEKHMPSVILPGKPCKCRASCHNFV